MERERERDRFSSVVAFFALPAFPSGPGALPVSSQRRCGPSPAARGTKPALRRRHSPETLRAIRSGRWLTRRQGLWDSSVGVRRH
ncbi:hypothetical protein E2C01_012007 [Portunus trituberculatus]|uniref:Uncharacterized protein n=1 Tax=Portunus trituberculatus TaxID=210409 RepID=A0A5B7DCZ4_PORTR|nr:hypothetical protein [Portunus trituberculatus]